MPTSAVRHVAAVLAVVALVAGGPVVSVARADEQPPDLTELSLEELMNIEVTSVSRKAERRSEAADAVYVITQEEMTRAGVRRLADALRLAPGVQVARVDASGWAIGVRGFANRLSRSVLVLVDGRSVYDPLFAGTYWEVLDYPIEDVDRIEIIRGPGGTLWGANAFNGIINIITKNARDTQGGYAEAGGGKEVRGFGGLRYGGHVGDDFYYRGYAKGFDQDSFHNPNGPDYDAWRMGQSGFRTDWNVDPRDTLSVHGDVFGTNIGERTVITQPAAPFRHVVHDDGDVSGGNVVGRWTRALSPRSDMALQVYYDNFDRQDPHFLERRNTADVDFQHRYRLLAWQEVIWGAGYRLSADRTEGIRGNVIFRPADRTLNLFSAFVQDEVTLVPNRFRVTVGSKFEHNDFTGFEVQPSGRFLWTPDARQSVWGAVARAVRTPSRLEDDIIGTAALARNMPVFVRVVGNHDFDAEKVVDYELGYRVRPLPRLYVDVTGFYNQYDDLLSVEPAGAPFTEPGAGFVRTYQPLTFANKLHGESYGTEVVADTSVTDWWRVNAAYSYLDIHVHRDPDSLDTSQEATAGDSPHNIVTVRSLMNLPARFQVDVVARYVDNLPNLGIARYVELDARVARRFGPVELSLVGQNLLHDRRTEFTGGTELERSAYVMARWWW